MASARNGGIVVAGGLTVLAAFTAIGTSALRFGSPPFLMLLACAAAGYAAAILIVATGAFAPSRRFLIGCAAIALACRVPLWMHDPGVDVYRYVWDARVQAAGASPYAVAPSDPGFAQLHTEETRQINHPDLPSPYPPGAQLFFRFVHLFSDRAWGFTVAFGICDVLLGVVVWRLLRLQEAQPVWILAYAWNPLVILVTAAEAHLDVLGALCLATAAVLLLERRALLSVLAFSAAVAVKPVPIVLAPLFWRRVRTRHAMAGGIFFLLLCLPYAAMGGPPVGSLGTFLGTFRFNDTIAFLLTTLFGRGAALVAAVGLSAAAAAWLQHRFGVAAPATWAWPIAILLAMSPVVYPWYLVWFMPFATGVATLPLLVWSVTVLSTYIVWHLNDLGRIWAVPRPVVFVEYVAVLATAAVLLRAARLRARARSGHDDLDRISRGG